MDIYIDLKDNRLKFVKGLITQNYKNHTVFDINVNFDKIKPQDICIFAPSHKWSEIEIEKLPQGVSIIGGKIDEKNAKKFNYHNIMQNEDFVYQNAFLTAECFLKELIENTKKSIYQEKILILGSGRVAKAIWKVFDKVGISFDSVMRNEKEKPFATLFSKKVFDMGDLKKIVSNYSVIINTVPAILFESDDCFDKDSVLFELASINSLEDNKRIKYILCPALPARFCPESSGEVMFETLKLFLWKEKKWI